MSESALHRTVADYLGVVLPPSVFWTTFPAGGGGRIRGALLKRAGLRPGVPDVSLIHGGRSLWIELKTDRGRLSPEQVECHQAIEEAGGRVATCRTLEQVRNALLSWSVPMREVRL